ncbi:hypothetical protein OsI_25790 [Oryza sativa Indica Group]|uniref:Uncharacterized protein n=1 Tax=Oryza sativa subsp. indica TaxID=39946 RepID=B8B5I3_ORYSI|nr:hypothetical protein OsI_25790 [Oryza sativa Indica Group]
MNKNPRPKKDVVGSGKNMLHKPNDDDGEVTARRCCRSLVRPSSLCLYLAHLRHASAFSSSLTAVDGFDDGVVHILCRQHTAWLLSTSASTPQLYRPPLYPSPS